MNEIQEFFQKRCGGLGINYLFGLMDKEGLDGEIVKVKCYPIGEKGATKYLIFTLNGVNITWKSTRDIHSGNDFNHQPVKTQLLIVKQLGY